LNGTPGRFLTELRVRKGARPDRASQPPILWGDRRPGDPPAQTLRRKLFPRDHRPRSASRIVMPSVRSSVQQSGFRLRRAALRSRRASGLGPPWRLPIPAHLPWRTPTSHCAPPRPAARDMWLGF